MSTFCITPRCGLCRFRLHDGELIIIGEPGSISSHCLSDLTIVKAGQSSEEMVYERIMVDLQKSRYITCVGDCSHLDGKTTGCHVECANQITPWPVTEAIEVLAFEYEPTAHEKDDRRSWLHHKLSVLLDKVLVRLPRELCSLIAGLCLRSYAVECARALRAVPSGESSIQLSSKIWGHFTDFEGSSYLSSLSNNNDDCHTQLMYVPKSMSTVTTIYLAEDYFGVRLISFCGGSTPTVENCRDLWWRAMDLESSPTLVAQNKGPKLRCFVPKDATLKQQQLTNVLWAIAPPKMPRMVQLERSPEATKMSAVLCNNPSIVAYSVHWDTRIMSIHTHTLKEELSTYQNRDNGIWLYFPLYRNEKVVEVWIRGSERLDLALLFRTSHGRTLVFGPHLSMQPRTRLALIDVLPQDSPSPETASSHSISLPQPTYKIPISTLQTPWFYSTASLDGVEDILPCVRSMGGRTRIIGLLLHYIDGHEACLGQVRLDCLGVPIRLLGCASVWCGISADRYGTYVVSFELSRPVHDQNIYLIEMNFRDSVDWWYSYHYSKIYPRK
ncbi:hypothetical protein CTAM01_17107 [Colletotrichum tamarilloi]|uniref:HET domain-containing protein n=1 Tax=Colletotrichum tamarilloi TaxID=1209934 RepID=A0ABQ9QGY9_9PEZI|nr:uncharacterized protein CTAM01_17107 [Colletotrichum tamarilloi]KAK1462381.1 hypothetical protein CTAM01_17107 [Colletotrichum tamarilloi]